MKKVLIEALVLLSIVSFIFLSIDSLAQSNVKINLFQVKYIGFDQASDTFKLSANISLNVPGHLTYLEEYYTIDGNTNPKFSSSRTYYDGALIGDDTGTFFNASFVIFRPDPHGGVTYSLVKSVVLLDNKRIYEIWLTKNKNFIDNTPTGDNTVSPLQNVGKYETREGIVIADLPVTFTYTSLGTIYEVNVTGKSNNDVSLRIEILKDTPSITYKPNGIVYGYLDTRADSDSIKELTPKYRIENSWIADNNIKGIGMFRWDSDSKMWVGLPTKVIDNDNKYVYLESVSQISTIFNNFAIVGFAGNISNRTPPKTNVTGGDIKPTDTNKTSGDSNKTEPLIKNIPGFQSVLVVLVIAFFIVLKKRRK